MKQIVMIAAIVMIALVGGAAANVVSTSDPEQPHVSFYVNKYTTAPSGWPIESYGYVEFRMTACNARDQAVFITRKGSGAVLDTTFHMDGTPVDNINPHMLKVVVYPDGASAREILAAGEYVAYVRNGHADQVESKEFSVGNGAVTYVVFQGQAMPTNHAELVARPEPTPEPTPCPNCV